MLHQGTRVDQGVVTEGHPWVDDGAGHHGHSIPPMAELGDDGARVLKIGNGEPKFAGPLEKLLAPSVVLCPY
jgi:hypothetical protein